MSVIIRLQNLPWSANASDIRDFFSGQAIPEGGVHIVGGELGDAFIAFSTDEDARLAMRKTGTALKGIQISLLLSSRTEMQKVIESARQQALGMQTYIAPPANIPQPTFQQQAVTLPNLAPPLTQQAHLPVHMQGPPQQASFQGPNQVPSQHALQPGFQPHVPSPQISIMHPSIPPDVTEEHLHLNPATPGIVLSDQMSQQHRSYNQQTYQTQIPQYTFQRPPLNNNFHPGVISPTVNANQFYGQPPVGVIMPGHLQNSPDIGSASPSNNSASAGPPKAPTPSVPIPLGTGAPEKIDKRSSSTSSKEGRDKRDSKGKDERRRHSKSRSRSRDRDRRRRHRTRSRSRSRDRSGRRRRSRSKERERKERDRFREDRGRSQRDRNERGSYNEPKPGKSDGEGGIPGLGEIPDDIPKEGLSIFSSAGAPSQAQGPITSSNEWPQREMKNETEIQEVTMEDAISDDDKNLPNLNLDQNSPMLKPPGFMGTQALPNFRTPPFQNSHVVMDNMDRSAPQTNARVAPKVWDTPPMDPRKVRPDVLSQQAPDPFMDQIGIPQRPIDMNQQGPLLRPQSSSDGVWNRPHPGRNEWEGPKNEQWNNNPQNGNWNSQQRNDNWENPTFARIDERNRTENKNLPPFIPDGMRNRNVFNTVETDRNRPPFGNIGGDRNNLPLDSRLKDDDQNRPPPLMREIRNQPFPDQENSRNQPPLLGREGPLERGDWKRQRNEDWNPSNSSSAEGDRWNRQPRNETWEKPPFPRVNERGRPPFLLEGNRGSRPPLIADEDRIRDSFSKEHRSPNDIGLDNKKSPYNERSLSSREEERNRPPILRDINKPFSEKESRGRPTLLPSPKFDEDPNRVPPLMGDDFELINSPSPGLQDGERRDLSKGDRRDLFRDDSHNSQRSSRSFDHLDREGPWNNERDFSSPHTMRTPSFSGGGNNFRDFHGGRRGGFGGREGVRDYDGSAGFRERDSHFRGRYDSEMGYRGRGRGGFVRGGRMSGPPYPHRERTPCIEVLHLATNLRHRVIKDFFVGAGIMVPSKSIKLLAHKQTKNPLGVALLKFGNTRDAFEATKLTGTCIYNSRVEINLIEENVYNEQKDIYEMTDIPETIASNPSQTATPNDKEPSDCIYVKGLPVGCTDHDVAKVFDKFKVSEVVLELEKGGRLPSGRCFVRFSSPDEAALALEKTDCPNIIGAPVKLMSCKVEELEVAKNEREKTLVAKPSSVRPSLSTSKPEKKQEVSKPLNSVNSGPEKMPKEILEAQKNLGNRPQALPATNNLAKNNSDPEDKAPLGDLLTDSVVLKNVSPDVTEVCIRDFFSDEGLIPEKIYFNKPDSEGKTDVFVIFPKTHNARKAVSKSSQLLRGAPVTIELINKPAVMNAMGLPFNPLELFKKGQSSEETQEKTKKFEVKKNEVPVTKKPLLQNPIPSPGSKPVLSTPSKPQSGGINKPVSFPNKTPPGSIFTQAKTPEPPPDFGKPGCVIALSNVPFNATTENILEFFKEFSSVVRPENIIRRYDEMNRPTADARVAFPNSNFAIQAVKKLDRKPLMNRNIKLNIVK